MIARLSFDEYYVAAYPPVQFFACNYNSVRSTCVVDNPLGVVAQMRYVCNIFITELLNPHLFHGMSPWVEADFTALSIKRKVGYFNLASCMQTNLGDPSYRPFLFKIWIYKTIFYKCLYVNAMNPVCDIHGLKYLNSFK